MQIMPTDNPTSSSPNDNNIEIAGTDTGTNITPEPNGMIADPHKDGIPLFLQTQNRDGAKPLLIFEVAKHALAAATTAEEVKDIRDKALGLALYAREANDRQLEAEAVEIRARAERRLGEMMQAQKATVGLNTGTAGMGRPSLGGSTDNPPKDDRPTLASQGIDKALAHEARTLAKMPEEEFEEAVKAKVEAIRTRTRKRKTMSAAERNERGHKRLERRIERQAQQVAENFPRFVRDACDWTALSPYREDPSYEHGDDYGDLKIPESVTAETAAELLPHIEEAIKNLKRLKAKLAEIAGGGGEARRVLQ
jgi:hypothetical protein